MLSGMTVKACRVATVLWQGLFIAAGLSAASPGRVVPLHAPLAVISADGNVGYTWIFDHYFQVYYFNTGRVDIALYDYKTDKIFLVDPNKERLVMNSYDYVSAYKRFISENITTGDYSISANKQLTILFTRQRAFLGRPVNYTGTTRLAGGIFFSPNEKLLLSGDHYNIYVTDVASGKMISKIVLGSGDMDPLYYDAAIAISANGKKLVVGDPLSFQIFNINPNHFPKNEAELMKGLIYDNLRDSNLAFATLAGVPLHGLAISPDNKFVVGGYLVPDPGNTRDPAINFGWIRNLESGQLVAKMLDQKNGIQQVGYSPNGKYLATLGGSPDSNSCDVENTLHLRDPLTGKTIRIFRDACYRVFFSPDSKNIIYSDRNFKLHIVSIR